MSSLTRDTATSQIRGGLSGGLSNEAGIGGSVSSSATEHMVESSGRPKKILAPCSTVDFSYRLGCTPSWWQLFKAFHELGNEVIAVPFLGEAIESLWWRTYPNPCRAESVLYNRYLEFKKRHGMLAGRKQQADSTITRYFEHHVRSKWERHLNAILEKEEDIDLVLFMNIPVNYIKGIARSIREEYGIPVGYLEGDMPTILPQYALGRGFKFNYYAKADLSEFDTFFTNSKGVIKDVVQLGARNVHPLYYAVDPELFHPVAVPKTHGVSFFGYGNEFREEWMNKMITEPSRIMKDTTFSVGGKGFSMDLGEAKLVGDLSYSAFRSFCCGSDVCLNITRWSHTSVYGSSTARPFELAGFGACMVSQPYNGLEEWFEVGKEVEVVSSAEEAMEAYTWLLDDPDAAAEMGGRARSRVLRDHSYRNRATEVLQAML